jgi:hypothetical protein
MRNMTQRAAPKPMRALYDMPDLHDICAPSAAGDDAELRRLSAELARVTQELHELKAATAQMVRYLI